MTMFEEDRKNFSDKSITILIRIIAIILMIYGAWKIINGFVISWPDACHNPLDILIAIILFRLGDNLFSLNNKSRIFGLVIIGFQIAFTLMRIVILILGKYSVTYNFEWLKNTTSNLPLIIFMCFILLLYIVLFIAFSSKRIRQLFQGNSLES